MESCKYIARDPACRVLVVDMVCSSLPDELADTREQARATPHRSRRRSPPGLPPAADTPFEGLAVQFGISSIRLSRDETQRSLRGGRREVKSAARPISEIAFEIHLRVNLLGLCHSLFPASTEQLVMLTAARIAGEVVSFRCCRFFHPFDQARGSP